MLNSRVRKAFSGFAVSIAGVLGAVGPAQAAVYHGSFDPIFGAIFPNLAWSADADFFVPDACLSQSGLVSNFSSCSMGGMKVLDASVTFHDSVDPSFAETLTFDPHGFSLLTLSVNIANGQLTGVTSFPSAPEFAYSEITMPGDVSYAFSLSFLGGANPGAKLSYARANDLDDLYFCSKNDPATECGFSLDTTGRGGTGGTIVYALVPEPSTYAMLLAGLGAVGFIARRRRT